MKPTIAPIALATFVSIIYPVLAAPNSNPPSPFPAPRLGPRIISARKPSPLPYPEGKLIYRVPVFDGQKEVEFSGTIQEIHNRIRAINPTFNALDATYTSNENSKRDDLIFAEPKLTDGPPLCFPFGPGVAASLYTPPLSQFLLNPNAACQNTARTCSRVSCINSAAVFWCNDYDDYTTIPCSWLADYGHKIVTDCKDGEGKVHGQLFSTKAFNVILTDWDCEATDRFAPPSGPKPAVPMPTGV